MAKRKAGDVEVGTHVQIHGDRKVGGDGVPKLVAAKRVGPADVIVRFHLKGGRYVDVSMESCRPVVYVRGSDQVTVCPVVSNALTIGVKQP